MKYTQNNGNDSAKHTRMLPVLLAAAMVLIMAVSVPVGWAQEFGEAHIFFELNNTDGDLGIHALIDGEGWKELRIDGPPAMGAEAELLNVMVEGRLQDQGLTEFFFESAEPPFDELSPDDFFDRFPEGTYTIGGITLEDVELESTVDISHVMPAPPVVYVNGQLAAEDCDAEELPVLRRYMPVFISWDPVTMSHPDAEGGGAGIQPPVPVTVHNYEVVVEIDETPWKTSTILPPDETSFRVPSELLALAEFDEDGEAEIKFEVLVRANNYNQTAIESCFTIKKWLGGR